jgi:hypothetical protein
MEMTKTVEEAKETLVSALPYFRKAVADARTSDSEGTVKMAIVHKYADGTGKVGMTFDCDEFFDDLALVLGAGPQTEEDDLKAEARKFVQKFGLK